MAVHVPLSVEAQLEARVLMMSTNNILSPAYGKPIIDPTQDIVLGCLLHDPTAAGSAKAKEELSPIRLKRFTPIEIGEIDLHARINVRIDKKRYETTAGRLILREIVPPEIPFDEYNRVMDKRALAELMDHCYRLPATSAPWFWRTGSVRWVSNMPLKPESASACQDMKIPKKKSGTS